MYNLTSLRHGPENPLGTKETDVEPRDRLKEIILHRDLRGALLTPHTNVPYYRRFHQGYGGFGFVRKYDSQGGLRFDPVLDEALR